MPKRDETGPMGYGPQTGWGDGHCAEARGAENTPQTGGCGVGRGYGRGRGAGRGLGRGRMAGRGGFMSQAGSEDEKHLLESRRDMLENQLQDLDRRLNALAPRETEGN